MLVLVICVLVILGLFIIKKEDDKAVYYERESAHHMQLFEITYKWLGNNKNGKYVTSYFSNNKVDNLAIYGKGKLGEMLYDEIKDKRQVENVFWIDRGMRTDLSQNPPIININDTQYYKNADVIVVTPVQYYDQIEKELLELGVTAEIVSLEDIIYTL